MTKHEKFLSYWDFDPEGPLQCSACGWTGRGNDAGKELFEQLFEVKCPTCDNNIHLVGYTTDEDTRVAAAAGNPRAQAVMPELDAHESS